MVVSNVMNFCRRVFFGVAPSQNEDVIVEGSAIFLEDGEDNDDGNHIPPCASPNNHDSDTDDDDDASPSPHPHRLPPAKRVKRQIKDDVVSSSPPQHVPNVYARVLLSTELLPVVAKFQPGAYVDILPFLKVRFCQCKTRRGLDRWVEYLEQLDTIFPAWYAIHGLSRIRHLHRCVPKGPTRAVIHAASVGNVTAMRRLRRMYRFKLVLDDCIIAAVINGQFNVLQYLHADESVNSFPKHCMQYAAACGHLGIVQFLDAYRPEACGGPAMNAAAEFGQLRVLKWLHYHRREGCNTWAMDAAAKYGHLAVVQWLHENRDEGCTVLALEEAAERGHFEVVTFLREVVRLPWSRRALKCMLRWGGPLEVLQDAHTAALDML
ncbi:hypothetical protein DYB37_004513 [Aphanomyces astaci]|uniref:Uncharacterized protein n=1 Tax=Aphanomyces astaci TaxID=112090 RepID=A0A3R7B8Q5_APHAT|nr:hypothetical protein DYB35_009323 [Aphanomyces astaci]RHZ19536.1 hypothetical protein DYB37_004513 [Aphanomyces astaci]